MQQLIAATLDPENIFKQRIQEEARKRSKEVGRRNKIRIELPDDGEKSNFIH